VFFQSNSTTNRFLPSRSDRSLLQIHLRTKLVPITNDNNRSVTTTDNSKHPNALRATTINIREALCRADETAASS
jgi:hypothetical protein